MRQTKLASSLWSTFIDVHYVFYFLNLILLTVWYAVKAIGILLQTIDIGDSVAVVVVDGDLPQRFLLYVATADSRLGRWRRWWPVEHGFFEPTVEHLDKTMRIAMVVYAASVTLAPAQRHQVEPLVARVHQVPRVPIRHTVIIDGDVKICHSRVNRSLLKHAPMWTRPI